MRDLPRGTVTFLFTDVEGSTRLLKQLRDGYGDVLDQHQRILREAFEGGGGQEIDTQGDSFFVAFRRAKDAVEAAVAAQRGLADHRWPNGVRVRVRMGLHTGEPAVGEERYVGLGVHKAARIGAAAHGGQILLSNTTRGLVEDELPPDIRLVDLGEHRLKDIDVPERIFQLNATDLPKRFPALRLEAPLPRARAWRRPGISRERALLLALAAFVVAAATIGIAVAIDRNEKSSPPGAADAGNRPTEPGKDPDTIVPGKSIGAVRLGMDISSVQKLYGRGREAQWRARGRTGSRVAYTSTGGALTVAYYDGRVVQVATSSPYYRTDDGIRVGVVAPSFDTLAEVKEAARNGALEELGPGVYTWKDFAVDFHSGLCLRGEGAATQLTPQGGPSHRVGAVWITDARFLAYLPAHIAGGTSGQATPSVGVYCAAQPLQP